MPRHSHDIERWAGATNWSPIFLPLAMQPTQRHSARVRVNILHRGRAEKRAASCRRNSPGVVVGVSWPWLACNWSQLDPPLSLSLAFSLFFSLPPSPSPSPRPRPSPRRSAPRSCELDFSLLSLPRLRRGDFSSVLPSLPSTRWYAPHPRCGSLHRYAIEAFAAKEDRLSFVPSIAVSHPACDRYLSMLRFRVASVGLRRRRRRTNGGRSLSNSVRERSNIW